MAKFNSYMLGRVVNSLGNVTTCVLRGENIARAKIMSRKDNPTPEILEQRAKMGLLIQLSRRLLPVVRLGFVGIGNGTTSNAFVQMNLKSVEVSGDYVATLDYTVMKVSSGILYSPDVTVSFDSEGNSFTFTQGTLEEESGFEMASDKMYGVLFESELLQVRVVALKTRGEGGNTMTNLPRGWTKENVHAYCFATSKNGKIVSDSTYLTIE